MIKRLRSNPTHQELSDLYKKPHQHDKWADHRSRVAATVALAQDIVNPDSRVADLSCGDAAIAKRLQPNEDLLFLGDFASGYQFTGPIEETIELIPPAFPNDPTFFGSPVNLFICCETLEHLENPLEVLKQIRRKSDKLLLSTPDGEWTNHNREHIWGWDKNGLNDLFTLAGWLPAVSASLDFRLRGDEYAYQVWICV